MLKSNKHNRNFSDISNHFHSYFVVSKALLQFDLRGCQLSKTNTCIIFTCIKKNDNFSKETGHS